MQAAEQGIWLPVVAQQAATCVQGNSFSFGMSQAKGAATVVDVGSGIMCGIAPRSGVHMPLLYS